MQEQLDRAFANAAWKLKFPNATITHLPAIRSDHKPLLFQSNPTQSHLPKPFRFETMWTTHLDSGQIIQEAWNRSPSFLSRIKYTKIALKEWNQKVFGHVQTQIKTLKSDLFLSIPIPKF